MWVDSLVYFSTGFDTLKYCWRKTLIQYDTELQLLVFPFLPWHRTLFINIMWYRWNNHNASVCSKRGEKLLIEFRVTILTLDLISYHLLDKYTHISLPPLRQTSGYNELPPMMCSSCRKNWLLSNWGRRRLICPWRNSGWRSMRLRVTGRWVTRRGTFQR